MFNFFRKKRESEIELMRSLASAYTREQHRSKINQALESLGIQLEPESNNSQYCIKATSALVRKIMEDAGTDFKNINEDQIFTGGLFLFTVSNHLTRLTGAPFEHVAAITPIDLFQNTHTPLEMADYVNAIAETYNNATNTTKVVEAIGQNLSRWIHTPTHDQFKKLVLLYKICMERIVSE